MCEQEEVEECDEEGTVCDTVQVTIVMIMIMMILMMMILTILTIMMILMMMYQQTEECYTKYEEECETVYKERCSTEYELECTTGGLFAFKYQLQIIISLNITCMFDVCRLCGDLSAQLRRQRAAGHLQRGRESAHG